MVYLVGQCLRLPRLASVALRGMPLLGPLVGRACAATVVATLIAGHPLAASADVVHVRDGRAGTASVSAAVVVPAPMPGSAGPPATTTAEVQHIVEPGEHLWGIAARELAGRADTAPTTGDVVAYWTRLCERNRDRLASGDPNVVFAGEVIVLPPVGDEG